MFAAGEPHHVVQVALDAGAAVYFGFVRAMLFEPLEAIDQVGAPAHERATWAGLGAALLQNAPSSPLGDAQGFFQAAAVYPLGLQRLKRAGAFREPVNVGWNGRHC